MANGKGPLDACFNVGSGSRGSTGSSRRGRGVFRHGSSGSDGDDDIASPVALSKDIDGLGCGLEGSTTRDSPHSIVMGINRIGISAWFQLNNIPSRNDFWPVIGTGTGHGCREAE